MDNNPKPPAPQVTFFASLCLFLSAVEYAIPHPVPFIRLGLANLPIMLSLQVFRRRDTILLCTLKILGQSLLSGTIFSYIFLLSAAGSFASCLLMMAVHAALWRTKKISWIGISIVGAFANNAGQLLVSRLMIFGENTKLIAPVLMAVSLVTGVLLGIFANKFTEKSEWWQTLIDDSTPAPKPQPEKNSGDSPKPECGIISKSSSNTNPTLTADSKPHNRRRFRFNPIPAIMTTITITLFALISPQGKVLFSIGSWRITEGALILGLVKSVKLVSMVFLSKLFVWRGFKFPGKIGRFVTQVIEGFEQLTSEKIDLKGKSIIQAIDARIKWAAS